MKKVCVSTFCVWSSYGSMLQAFGLQHALKEIDCQGVVALPDVVPKKRWCFEGFTAKSLKGLVVDAHKLLISGKIKNRYAAANSFIRKYIQVEYTGNYDNLRNHPPRADAYIVGSDQVWNPRKMAPDFFLEHIPEGYPRISYAASMGVTRIPAENREGFQRMVAAFDHISVRERDNLSVINECTDRPAQVHIDPVFLVSRDRWREMEVPYPIDGPYILVYPIYWDKGLNQQLKQLHQQTGKTIVAVLGQIQQVYANQRIYDASPEQFLWLIDHADAVVSSSFHGVAMSLVFGKRFSAVIDPNSPSRLTCLLDTLGAQNRAIMELVEDQGQDQNAISRRIEEEKVRSVAYLRKVLYGS